MPSTTVVLAGFLLAVAPTQALVTPLVAPSPALIAPSSVQLRSSPRAGADTGLQQTTVVHQGPLRRGLASVRRAYGEYASRCDGDACNINGFRFGVATRPTRWAREAYWSVFPKPRALARLSLCEGGAFKVKTEEEGTRTMIYVVDEKAPDTCAIDML